MRNFILILFLLMSVNSFAGYMSKSLMLNSDCDVARPFYPLKKQCDINHADCISVPLVDRICNLSELDTSVDDLTKPIFTKSEMVTCTDATDCQAKLAAKICADVKETAIKNLDLMEVYCSKDSFSQKIVKQIREDSIKKLAYDAAQAALAAANLSRRAKRLAAKSLISKLQGGTDLTNAELRQVLLAILMDLKN